MERRGGVFRGGDEVTDMEVGEGKVVKAVGGKVRKLVRVRERVREVARWDEFRDVNGDGFVGVSIRGDGYGFSFVVGNVELETPGAEAVAPLRRIHEREVLGEEEAGRG